MTNPVAIKGGQSVIVRDTNGVHKTLFKPTKTNALQSAHDATNADYQVPTGKKFIITKVYGWANDGGTGNLYIYAHTVADTAGGTLVFNPSTTGSNPSGFYLDIEVFISIAAGNYVNLSGGPANMDIWVTGIEVDV